MQDFSQNTTSCLSNPQDQISSPISYQSQTTESTTILSNISKTIMMSQSISATTPSKNGTLNPSAANSIRSINSKYSTANIKTASVTPNVTIQNRNSIHFLRENRQISTTTNITNSSISSNACQSPSQSMKQNNSYSTHFGQLKSNCIPSSVMDLKNIVRQPLQPRTDILQISQQQSNKLTDSKLFQQETFNSSGNNNNNNPKNNKNIQENLRNSQQINRLIPYSKGNTNSIPNKTQNLANLPQNNENQNPIINCSSPSQQPADRLPSRNSISATQQLSSQSPQAQSSSSPMSKAVGQLSAKNNYQAYFKTGQLLKVHSKSKLIDLSSSPNPAKKTHLMQNSSIKSTHNPQFNPGNSVANIIQQLPQHHIYNSLINQTNNNLQQNQQQLQKHQSLQFSQVQPTQQQENSSVFIFNTKPKQSQLQSKIHSIQDNFQISQKLDAFVSPNSKIDPSLSIQNPSKAIYHPSTQFDSSSQETPINIQMRLSSQEIKLENGNQIQHPNLTVVDTTTYQLRQSVSNQPIKPQELTDNSILNSSPKLKVISTNILSQRPPQSPVSSSYPINITQKSHILSLPHQHSNQNYPETVESIKTQKLRGFSNRLTSSKEQFTCLQSTIEKKQQEQIDNYHIEVARVEEIQNCLLQIIEKEATKTKELLLQGLNESLRICRDTAFQVTQILNYLSSTENDLLSNLPSIVHDMDMPSLEEITNQYDVIIESYNKKRESNFAAVHLSQVSLQNSVQESSKMLNITSARLAAELNSILSTSQTTFPLLPSQESKQNQENLKQLQDLPTSDNRNNSNKSIYVSFENKDIFSSQSQNLNQFSNSFQAAVSPPPQYLQSFQGILNQDPNVRISFPQDSNKLSLQNIESKTIIDSPAFLNPIDIDQQMIQTDTPRTSSFAPQCLTQNTFTVYLKSQDNHVDSKDFSIQENQLQHNNSTQINSKQENYSVSLTDSNVHASSSFNSDTRNKYKQYTELINKIQVRQSQTEKLCSDVLSAGINYQQQEQLQQSQLSQSVYLSPIA